MDTVKQNGHLSLEYERQFKTTDTASENERVAYMMRKSWAVVGKLIMEGIIIVDFNSPEWNERIKMTVISLAMTLAECE